MILLQILNAKFTKNYKDKGLKHLLGQNMKEDNQISIDL